MTDVSNSEPDGGPSSPPPAFPPPVPSETSGASSRLVGMLALLALTGLAVGVIMTILWLGAKGDADDSAAERDNLIAERDAATRSLTDVQTDLTAARTELATAQSDLETAQRALADATDDGESAVDDAGVAALEAQIAQLEADAATAAAENERLTQELAAATAASASDPDDTGDAPTDDTTPEDAGEPADDGPPADESEPADSSEPAETTDEAQPSGADFDVTTTPNFARYVGELLSSTQGSSRLSAADAGCFGGGVIESIGLEALGSGQFNAATRADRQIVIDAMVDSAAACGIDRNLIF